MGVHTREPLDVLNVAVDFTSTVFVVTSDGRVVQFAGDPDET